MEPNSVGDIAEPNTAELERARASAENPSTLDLAGDTATQLDSLGQIVEFGGLVFNGLRAAGDCIAAVCDAIPTLD